MLTIQHLTKSFNGIQVLQDFSCSFPETGIVSLVGPSGCGKTTLLRCIAGLEHPDSGIVSGIPERIAYCFQEDRLLPGGQRSATWKLYWASVPNGKPFDGFHLLDWRRLSGNTLENCQEECAPASLLPGRWLSTLLFFSSTNRFMRWIPAHAPKWNICWSKKPKTALLCS